MKLSILARTAMAHYAVPFLKEFYSLAKTLEAEFVVAVERDAVSAFKSLDLVGAVIVPTDAKRVPDNIVDDGVAWCSGDYVLRLDDDESCSDEMKSWLYNILYVTHDHWKFPRVHLYKTPDWMIVSSQLWPDHQTRLSVKKKAGGLFGQHAGSPFGGGEIAPCWLEHYKFVVRDYAERTALAAHYDSYCQGHGTGGMRAFCLPEDEYADGRSYRDGGAVVIPYAQDAATMNFRIQEAQQ